MSALTEFDIGPLTWVKGEIDQALGKAQENLAQFSANVEDASQLRFCQTHLHQVKGAIQMVGLDGLARCSDEIEKFVAALEKREIEPSAANLALLDGAIAAISKYLADLLNGEPDVPLRLFPVYKGLLEAQGAERISEGDLFFPDLSVRAPKNLEVQAVAEAELPRYVKSQRTSYQKGLLGWLRNERDSAGLQAMANALVAIENTQVHPAGRTFWWSAAAFLDGLAQGGITPDFTTKQLCGRIDQQIRRLAEGSSKVAERLLRDVLYFTARSEPATDRLKAVKQAFELEDYLPKVAAVSEAAQAERDRIQPLLRELRDALAPAKDAWLKFTAGNRDSLKGFRDQFKRLLDRSGSLDNQPLQNLLNSIDASAEELIARADAASEPVAMEMATALLLAESALENYARLGDEFERQSAVQIRRLEASVSGVAEETGMEDAPLLDEMSRRAQEKLLLAQVGQEIQTNLRHIEQVLDTFFRDHSRRADLPALDAFIKQIFGAFQILELERAADLLKACQALIRDFANPEHAVQQEDMELVAEGLSSLGFYVEALQHGRADAFEVIAPVLRRFPEIKGREEAAPAEEAEVVDTASIESGLEEQKRQAQIHFNAWRQDAENSAARENLRKVLSGLNQDADLVDDAGLKDKSAAAMQLLEQAGDAPGAELAQAIKRLTAPKMATVAPSAETSRLAEASDEVIDAELLETYLEEAQEVLATVREHLQLCRQQPQNRDALTTIRRGFHTLKGSGRMVGLTALGEAAWGVEQVMNKWLEEEKHATPELLEFIQRAHDAFEAWVDVLRREGAVEVDDAGLMAEAAALKRSLETEPVPVIEEAAPAESPVEPAPVQPVADELEEESAAAEIEIEGAPVSGEAPEISWAPAAEPEADAFPEIEAVAISADELAETAAAQTIPEMEAFPESEAAATPVETAEAVEPEIEPFTQEVEPETAPEMEAEAAPLQPEETGIVIGEVNISPALYETFIKEAAQHLATLETELDRLCEYPEDPIRHDFMRAAHTLGGISSTVGFSAPADLSNCLEQWLLELLEHPHPATAKPLKVMDDSITALKKMVQTIEDRKPPKPAKQIMRSLQALLKKARTTRESIAAAQETPDETLSEPEPEPTVSLATAPTEVAPPQKAALPVIERRADRDLRDDIDEQLLPIFLEEAQELFPLIGKELRAWRAAPADVPTQNSLQRALHTLKGSARMAGAMRLGELTHNMETGVVDAMESGMATPALFDEMDAHFDRVSDLLDQLQHGPQSAATDVSVAAKAVVPAVAAPLLPEIDQSVARAVLRVRAATVDRLVNEAGEVSIARSRIEGEMRGFKQTLLDLTENVIRLRGQLREVEIQAESQMQSRLSHAQEEDSAFDPLEFDRFTRLQELTRMMAESVNDVSTIQQTLLKGLDETEAALLQQARMNRELQQELMHMRMVPLSSISERLHRIVRQTSRELDKQATLDIRGTSVELDRSVLEKMTAPFEHVLRNAIAHGLESSEERARAGKPESGQITLQARQEGNEIVLTVSDDGAGLNLERIRDKAQQLGLLSQDAETSDGRLMEMIFLPGFSTAQEVTQVSGRGIGMDVVRSEIAGLGGRLEVSSEPGKGTTFTIFLPLTLAVTQAVLVRAGEAIYALPSAMVEQVQELKPGPLAQAYGQREINWMGNRYPLFYLPRLLGDPETSPEAKPYTFILLLRSGTQRAAIHVDGLMGNQEVVIKNIGPQLARVPGVTGATVLGTGRIVLIINPVQLAHREALPAAAAHIPAALTEPEQLATAPLVLVVDDSLTVRKITGRLLAKEGYQVVTAKDGVDALQQLQSALPDVMLVDIEMPRMDGFELTKNVRSDPKTAHIPIIMITSRTAEKHRNYAKELGVNAYLGKPYQEEELLNYIEGFVGKDRKVTADY